MGFDQPRLSDTERLTTHVTQQAFSPLDVYLHYLRTMLLEQRVDLRRMKHRVCDDRHSIIIATDGDPVAQIEASQHVSFVMKGGRVYRNDGAHQTGARK